MLSTHAPYLLGQAILAPSSHNTQPWLFTATDSAILLHADRTRALAVNDPYDRELTISCAAALFNLRAAAAHRGVPLAIELFPDPHDPDCLARAMPASQADAQADPEEAILALAIEHRRTYRHRFSPQPVPDPILTELLAAARLEGAALSPVFTETNRHAVAALIAEGDALQWANPSWRRELASWMHPRRSGDGLTVPGPVAPLAQLVVRTFDMGGGIAAKDRELADGSPVLAVLSTPADEPADWMAAGQALERVLLLATHHGLQASYLNQPVEIPTLRTQLEDLIRAGVPQLVFRLGYPTHDLSPTPRRPLSAHAWINGRSTPPNEGNVSLPTVVPG